MTFSVKKIIPITTISLLSITSCTPSTKARDYMLDKPYTEYKSITSPKYPALIQSKLDSVAYRDLFNETYLAKDSSAITDFNKIAASMRGYNEFDLANGSRTISAIQQSTIKAGITTREYDKMNSMWNSSVTLQHNADKWAYKRFFEKIGLMKTHNFNHQFNNISKKIEP